jgi:hypothetical protein
VSKAPITEAQLKRLQADYSRLKREDDPRTHGPTGTRYPDDREGRVQWGRDHLGAQKLESFSDLTVLQAGYLIDILAGVTTKLDLLLRELIVKAKIADPDRWFEAVQSKRNYWYFQGRKLHQLNRYQKWKLCDLLTARHGEVEPVKQRSLWEEPHGQTQGAEVPRGNH